MGAVPVAAGVTVAAGMPPVGGESVAPPLVAGAVAVGGVTGTGLPSGRGLGLAAVPQPAVTSTSAMTTATTFIGSPPPLA
jgi:hypothetical protein